MLQKLANFSSLFVFMVAGAASAATSASYTVTALPRITGTAANIGYAINTHGDVVGQAYGANGQQAFVFSNGVAGVIPGLRGATDINDFGQVVGGNWDPSTSASKAYVYSPSGVLKELGNLGGPDVWASSINNSGHIVGYSDTTPLYTGPYSAFISSSNGMSRLGLTAAELGSSFAYGVNASGQVVGALYAAGSAWAQAFLYSAGTTTLLGSLGGQGAGAQAISDNGLIVGDARLADGSSRAFIYDGTMKDLGTISGSQNLGYGLGTPAYSGARNVNSRGQVVGTFGFSGYQGRGFVYLSDGMHDLNDIAPAGWEITDAMDINEAGQILAYGYRKGEFIGTALILSPIAAVPEPSGTALALLGLTVLGVSMIRRRVQERQRDGC